MTSGTQHLERRLGKNRATNRRHLEAMGRPILGDKSEFWKAIGRQLGTHPSETSGRQLELEETAPQSKTNELPQGETNDLETTREPDTTSQTGRQINCHKGRQRIGDRRRAGHHQPDWETNELPQGRETNELETGEEPDTTSQTGKQINCHKGRHMNWRQARSRTLPARLGDK